MRIFMREKEMGQKADQSPVLRKTQIAADDEAARVSVCLALGAASCCT